MTDPHHTFEWTLPEDDGWDRISDVTVSRIVRGPQNGRYYPTIPAVRIDLTGRPHGTWRIVAAVDGVVVIDDRIQATTESDAKNRALRMFDAYAVHVTELSEALRDPAVAAALEGGK